MPELDCQRCGACCFNPPANRAEGFFDWVEVEPRAALLRRRRMVDRLVVTGADGRPHLRLTPDQHCAALEGRLGERVHCTIYALRPKACRKVEAGSSRCLEYRRALGLSEPGRRARPRSC